MKSQHKYNSNNWLLIYLSRVSSWYPNTFIWESNMVAEQKLKGPASYFPSIEKKYGQPIDHWIKLVQKQKDMKHMEVVNWLKNEYGLGHGHANAIVAYCFAQKSD